MSSEGISSSLVVSTRPKETGQTILTLSTNKVTTGLFPSSVPVASKSSANLEEYVAWGRAVLCIYLITSISWRLAFYTEFVLDLLRFPGFIVTDLVATVFFSYDTIRLAKLQWDSSRKILPETVDIVKESISSSQQSLEEVYNESNHGPSRFRVLLYFLATVPLEFVPVLFLRGEWTNYFMMNRLLRIIYLPKYLNDLSTVLGRKGYLKNIGVRRTWLLFFTMALAGHLCGCGFYFVARKEALNGVVLTWPEVAGIYVVGSDEGALAMLLPAVEAYITSLYWAYITMVSLGLGMDSSPCVLIANASVVLSRSL